MVHRMPAAIRLLLAGLTLLILAPAGEGAPAELRAKVAETKGVSTIEYWSGPARVGRSTEAAPAGVALRLPGANSVPVEFRASAPRAGGIELGPAKVGALTLRLRLEQRTPALVEQVLEVRAETPQRFAVTFSLDLALDGEFATFSGPEKARALYDTVRGSITASAAGKNGLARRAPVLRAAESRLARRRALPIGDSRSADSSRFRPCRECLGRR